MQTNNINCLHCSQQSSREQSFENHVYFCPIALCQKLYTCSYNQRDILTSFEPDQWKPTLQALCEDNKIPKYSEEFINNASCSLVSEIQKTLSICIAANEIPENQRNQSLVLKEKNSEYLRNRPDLVSSYFSDGEELFEFECFYYSNFHQISIRFYDNYTSFFEIRSSSSQSHDERQTFQLYLDNLDNKNKSQ